MMLALSCRYSTPGYRDRLAVSYDLNGHGGATFEAFEGDAHAEVYLDRDDTKRLRDHLNVLLGDDLVREATPFVLPEGATFVEFSREATPEPTPNPAAVVLEAVEGTARRLREDYSLVEGLVEGRIADSLADAFADLAGRLEGLL